MGGDPARDTGFFLGGEPTARYLRIAGEALETVRSGLESDAIEIPGEETDAAAVVTVFAAAAIESALNRFLALPLLAIPDERLQSFFGYLVTQYMRAASPQKVAFAKKFAEGLGDQRDLLGRVQRLVEYRNKLIHPTPRYGTHLGLPAALAEAIDWGDEIDEEPELYAEYPHLATHEVGREDLEAAVDHYETAIAFIEALSVHRPPFVEARDDSDHVAVDE